MFKEELSKYEMNSCEELKITIHNVGQSTMYKILYKVWERNILRKRDTDKYKQMKNIVTLERKGAVDGRK